MKSSGAAGTSANLIARDWPGRCSLATGCCSLSVLWGGSFFFNGVVLRELPPFTPVLLRVTIAAIILLPGLWIYRLKFPEGWIGLEAVLRSSRLFNNVLPFSLIVTGQTYVASGLASILNATTPLFTVVVMATAGEEKLVSAPHRRRDRGPRRRGDPARQRISALPAGRGSASCCALPRRFSYGISALIARRHFRIRRRWRPRRFSCWLRALMMTVVAGVVERPWQLPMPGTSTWLAVLGLAALSTALAYIVFFQILRRSGATNVMLVTLLIPVTAILLGYFALGERSRCARSWARW